MDKFLLFLESLESDANKPLIESIIEGYLLIESFSSPENFNVSKADPIKRTIAVIQEYADKFRDGETIDIMDNIMGLIKAKRFDDAIRLTNEVDAKYQKYTNQLIDGIMALSHQ